MGQHQLAAVRQTDQIALEVARKAEELFGLLESETFFGTNTGNVVMARRLAWYVLFIRWRYSYPQIGAVWNHDQSTVRAGVLVICDELKFDRELQQKAKALGV
jgi:chromosomal replication initiation ATPase DnaA